MDPILTYLKDNKIVDIRQSSFLGDFEKQMSESKETKEIIYPKVKLSTFEEGGIELANIDSLLNFTNYWGGLYYNNSNIKTFLVDLSPSTFSCSHYLQYRCFNSRILSNNINTQPEYIDHERLIAYDLPKKNALEEQVKLMPFEYTAVVGKDVDFDYTLKFVDFLCTSKCAINDLPLILIQNNIPTLEQLEALSVRFKSVNFFKLASSGNYCLYGELPGKLTTDTKKLELWRQWRLNEMYTADPNKLSMWKCPKIWHLPTIKTLF